MTAVELPLGYTGFSHNSMSGNRDLIRPTAWVVDDHTEQTQQPHHPEGIDSRRAIPGAAYRLQFHAGFTFRDARVLVPYLADLGITHVYASPYLKAVAGSRHGYNIVDPSSINSELGSEQDFEDFVHELHVHGLGQILDVVPNHMGVATNDNVWWSDVLENGPSSTYSSFFDIDWMPLKPDLANKVLLPMLGDQYGHVLEDGQLILHFEDGLFYLQYFDRHLPIAVRSSSAVLCHRLDQLKQDLSLTSRGKLHSSDTSAQPSVVDDDEAKVAELMEYESILTAIGHLPPRTETNPDRIHEGRREQEVIKRRLRDLCQTSPMVNDFVVENVRLFNGRPGDPSSFDLLDQLLLDQAYRLSHWRVAADEINYRRFFDVNELAAICMERPEVFEKTHCLILRHIQQGAIDGLRIDHVDGLYDPIGYLQRLRSVRPDPPLYLIVEKILGHGEHLPNNWPIDGTTGYEFLNAVNGLFVNCDGARAFDRLYARFVRRQMSYRDLVYYCKKQIMDVSMSSEIGVLGHRLDRISEQNRQSRDFTLNSLTDALREIIACFPVYRTYISTDGDEPGVSHQDQQYVEQAVARAKRRNPAISTSIFDFIRDVLLLRVPKQASESQQVAWRRFVGRFQQVTGPVMAKGVEDTACYIFNRLVSLNEVGNDPDKFGTPLGAFHKQNQERQVRWPHALLATSTHDTKRTEDVRARLNVLSENPAEWQRRLGRWSRLNARKKRDVDGEPAPSRNDEYLLYQTLVGTWPLERPTASERITYLERIEQYMLKAAHEAKVHTSWVSPHEPYEQALADFIAALLADSSKNAFLADFAPFAQRIGACGLWNSLAQTLLKLTSPGVPDTYQGCELWDFSLVDPDNRRPVDYERRRRMLAAIRTQPSDSHKRLHLIRDMLDQPFDGRLKMFVIVQVLCERRLRPELFTIGRYLPLEASGPRQDHVCAYARQTADCKAIVVVPRLMGQFTGISGDAPMGEAYWPETSLVLPPAFAKVEFQNLFTNEIIHCVMNASRCELRLGEVLQSFPVALLRQSTEIHQRDCLPASTPNEALTS